MARRNGESRLRDQPLTRTDEPGEKDQNMAETRRETRQEQTLRLLTDHRDVLNINWVSAHCAAGTKRSVVDNAEKRLKAAQSALDMFKLSCP